MTRPAARLHLSDFLPSEREMERNESVRARPGQDPCVVCHRPVDKARAQYVELTTDNEIVLDDSSPPNSQGGFPVGPDCYRRLLAAAARVR